jgi:membrane-associated phospholipid phosphatase
MSNGTWMDRIKAYIWLKAIGSTLAISLFFVAYFFVMNHPVFEVREMPLVWPDQWMPVLPWTTWVYFSLWVYICLPSTLLNTPKALGHYLLGAFVLSILGLSIFLFLPTAVPEWGFDWNDYPTLSFLKQSDASGNACPSLHVGFAVFSGLWLHQILNTLQAAKAWHWISGVWCLAIILSTLTTKQHVIIDVVCGIIFGVCVYLENYFWMKRLKIKV